MSNFVLVIVLLYSNSDAFIDISRPMTYEECAVFQAEANSGEIDELLEKLNDKPFTLRWFACREIER